MINFIIPLLTLISSTLFYKFFLHATLWQLFYNIPLYPFVTFYFYKMFQNRSRDPYWFYVFIVLIFLSLGQEVLKISFSGHFMFEIVFFGYFLLRKERKSFALLGLFTLHTLLMKFLPNYFYQPMSVLWAGLTGILFLIYPVLRYKKELS